MDVAQCQLVIPLTQRQDAECWASLIQVVQELRVASEKGRELPDVKRTHYLAILSAIADRPPFNRWLVCHQDAPAVPDTPTSGRGALFRQICGWGSLVQELIELSEAWSTTEPKHGEEVESLVQNTHFLMDHLPWRPDEYVLVDVYLLVSGSACPSLSLQGVFMRLREWLGAHFHVLVSPSNRCLPEWGEYLMPSVSSSADDMEFSWDVLWRGPLLLHEQKPPGKAQGDVLCFDGFSLQFSHDSTHLCDRGTLDATGLIVDPTHHPSHLEVVQVVDVTTFPIMWLSPLCLTLSLDESHRSSLSGAAFRQLFHPATNRGAVLLRLCLTRPEHESPPARRTTEDWMRDVMDRDIPTLASFSSCLSPGSRGLPSDCDGAFLYVHPRPAQRGRRDGSRWTCRAWLLWKPAALLGPAAALSRLKEQQQKEVDADGPSSSRDIFDGLPMFECKEKQRRCVEYERKDFLTDFYNYHGVGDPSQWAEMKALSNHEWIQSHTIKRRTTPELMFGTVVAPPPSNKGTPTIDDILKSFTESGTPNDPELSPVAMSGCNESSRPVHMVTPGKSPVSYWKVLGSTPTSARKYHGVRYCLSEKDVSLDVRLTKIQQRYLSRERTSYCLETDLAKKTVSRRKRKQPVNRVRDKDICPTVDQKPSSQQETGNSLRAHSAAVMGMRGRCLSSRGTGRAGSRRVKLISRMDKMAPASQVTTKTITRETMANKATTVATNPALSAERVAISADEGRSEDASLSHREPSRRSSSQTTEVSARKRALQPRSPIRTNATSCLSEEENVPATTNSPCTGTGPSDAASSKVGSGAVVETKSAGAKRRDPTSKKKLLEIAVVASLKTNGLPRSHPCFKKAYVKLFDLSKLFLKDLNFKDSKIMSQEIEKVVSNNAQQVIAYVVKQAKTV